MIYLADPVTARTWARLGLAQPRVEAITRRRNDLLELLGLASGSLGELETARDVVAEIGADTVVGRFVALCDGRWEEAEGSWATALQAYLAAGDVVNATLTAFWLAGVQQLLGRDSAALSTLERALAWSLQGPQVPAELMIRAELARMLPTLGDVAAASDHLTRCDEIMTGGEDWRGRAGHIELAQAEGERRLAAARAIYSQLGANDRWQPTGG
jgi:hypothetical protein